MREDTGDFRTEVLEESGHDGKAADEDAGCHLGGRPEAHAKDVVADVWRLNYLPCVDGTQDGGGAGAICQRW